MVDTYKDIMNAYNWIQFKNLNENLYAYISNLLLNGVDVYQEMKMMSTAYNNAEWGLMG